VLNIRSKEAPCEQVPFGGSRLGIDLHRRRSVNVRTTADSDPLECIRISEDVERLATVMARARRIPRGWGCAICV
jgi:hypothetical protein